MLLVDSFRDSPDCFWSVLQLFRKRAKLPKTVSATPTGPDPVQIIEIQIPNSLPAGATHTFKWDMTSQHTLSWEEPITAVVWDESLKCEVAVTLNAGSCNLYTYPKVVWKEAKPATKGFLSVVTSAVQANKKKFEILSGAHLQVFHLVFKTIAENPLERDVLKLGDWSGACSVLGMLVANTEAALDCVFSIYRAWPEMMAMPHHPGFFVGENAFHVLAVNSQEDRLCDMITMAYEQLDREQLRSCFTSQCMGLFFQGEPMYQYGAPDQPRSPQCPWKERLLLLLRRRRRRRRQRFAP